MFSTRCANLGRFVPSYVECEFTCLLGSLGASRAGRCAFGQDLDHFDSCGSRVGSVVALA